MNNSSNSSLAASSTSVSQTNLPPVYFAHHSREGTRLITTIGDYPFYCSTGNNSGYCNTYFPFSGINIQYGMMFIKPKVADGLHHYPAEIHNLLNGNCIWPILEEMEIGPEEWLFVETSDPNSSEKKDFDSADLHLRFGNFECMVISSLIGGGLWNTRQGKALNNYLRKKWSSEVESISQKHQEAIHALKHLNSNQINHVTDDHSNEINYKLSQRAARFETVSIQDSDNHDYHFPVHMNFKWKQDPTAQEAEKISAQKNNHPMFKATLLLGAYCSDYFCYLDRNKEYDIREKCRLVNSIQNSSLSLNFSFSEPKINWTYLDELNALTEQFEQHQDIDEPEKKIIMKINNQIAALNSARQLMEEAEATPPSNQHSFFSCNAITAAATIAVTTAIDLYLGAG